MGTPAEYPEDLVPILVQTAIALQDYPQFTSRLTPISRRKEKERGYDAELSLRGRLVYLQFKKPFYIKGRRNNEIFEARRLRGLDMSKGCLYFSLHKNKLQEHEQHNALVQLNEESPDCAIYLCPVFRWTEDYQRALQTVLRQSLKSPGTTRANCVQFLDQHVSIRPTFEIKDSLDHSYSFSLKGQHVLFHPDLALKEKDRVGDIDFWGPRLGMDISKEFPEQLSAGLGTLLQSIGDHQVGIPFPGDGLETILPLLKRFQAYDQIRELMDHKTIQGKDIFAAWMQFGEFLEDKFNILQCLFEE